MPRTFTSREFARGLSTALNATSAGPVFITRRGRPTHVLLTVEAYDRLIGKRERSLLEMMNSFPDADAQEWRPARMDIALKPAKFD